MMKVRGAVGAETKGGMCRWAGVTGAGAAGRKGGLTDPGSEGVANQVYPTLIPPVD